MPPPDLGGPEKAESPLKKFLNFSLKTSGQKRSSVGRPRLSALVCTQNCELMHSKLFVTVCRTHSTRKFHSKMTLCDLCTKFLLTEITYDKACSSALLALGQGASSEHMVSPVRKCCCSHALDSNDRCRDRAFEKCQMPNASAMFSGSILSFEWATVRLCSKLDSA